MTEKYQKTRSELEIKSLKFLTIKEQLDGKKEELEDKAQDMYRTKKDLAKVQRLLMEEKEKSFHASKHDIANAYMNNDHLSSSHRLEVLRVAMKEFESTPHSTSSSSSSSSSSSTRAEQVKQQDNKTLQRMLTVQNTALMTTREDFHKICSEKIKITQQLSHLQKEVRRLQGERLLASRSSRGSSSSSSSSSSSRHSTLEVYNDSDEEEDDDDDDEEDDDEEYEEYDNRSQRKSNQKTTATTKTSTTTNKFKRAGAFVPTATLGGAAPIKNVHVPTVLSSSSSSSSSRSSSAVPNVNIIPKGNNSRSSNNSSNNSSNTSHRGAGGTAKPPSWGRSFSAKGGQGWKNPTPFGDSNGKYIKHGYDGMGGMHNVRGSNNGSMRGHSIGHSIGQQQKNLQRRSNKPTSATQVASKVKRGSKRSFAAAAKAVASVVGRQGGGKKKVARNSIANFFAGNK